MQQKKFPTILMMLLFSCLQAWSQQDVKTLALRLDSMLISAEKAGFHGNILFVAEGKTMLNKGYGWANETDKVAFAPGTPVQIGSNVKDFTKVAILQLVEQGKLKPGDSLGKFIDQLPTDKQAITVRHLLNHTAGLPLGIRDDATPLTSAEMLDEVRNLKLLSAPGAGENYSNLGYSLLAFIVEKLSGMSYDAYVAKYILQPAGLQNTGTYLPPFDPSKIAHGYRGAKDMGTILEMPHDADGHLWSLRGNGGYLSTLSDMNTFYRALRTPTLLKEEKHRLAVYNPHGADILAGSDLVCYFFFANFPDIDGQVFLATNHSSYPGNKMMRQVEALLDPSAGKGPVERDGNGSDEPLIETLPGDGFGATIRAYLDAFNTGDTAVMRQFFSTHALSGPQTPPMEVRLERYQQIKADLGQLTFKGYRKTPEAWEVVVEVASGEPVTFAFLGEEEKPYRLKGLRIER